MRSGWLLLISLICHPLLSAMSGVVCIDGDGEIHLHEHDEYEHLETEGHDCHDCTDIPLPEGEGAAREFTYRVTKPSIQAPQPMAPSHSMGLTLHLRTMAPSLFLAQARAGPAYPETKLTVSLQL